MWLATSTASDDRQRPESPTAIVGTITLGRAGRPPNDAASVQWLMVPPEYQRRGIGRLLLAALEAEAWRLGERTLTLETHVDWIAAVRLYRVAGYVDV